MPRAILAVLLLLNLSVPSRALLGVGDTSIVNDPLLNTTAKAHLAISQLHNKFMELQAVKDFVEIKNNALAAKETFDYFDQKSRHRGGLVGYYKDYLKKEMNSIADEELSRINNEASTITGNTAVGTLVNHAANAITNTGDAVISAGVNGAFMGMSAADSGYGRVRGVVFSQQKDKVAARDQWLAVETGKIDAAGRMLGDLVARASVDMISDHGREMLEMQAMAQSLQQMYAMRKTLALIAEIQNTHEKNALVNSAIGVSQSGDYATFRQNTTPASSLNSAATPSPAGTSNTPAAPHPNYKTFKDKFLQELGRVPGR